MKVICKNCGKRFDYDLYMGLCPGCSTYYREGMPDASLDRQRPQIRQEKEEQTYEQPHRVRHTDKKPKHGKVYYVVSFVLLSAIAANVILPVVFHDRINRLGRQEMELDEGRMADRISMGETFSYAAEQGEYQVAVTGAEVDKRKELATPKYYQYIAVSYKLLPPVELQDRENQTDNPAYYGIHMKPYLMTKSGKYLEPLYPFQIAERMGWDDAKQRQLGLSDDFVYQKGVIYFLARKGDLEGILVNSFDYDEEHYCETALRESFEIRAVSERKEG